MPLTARQLRQPLTIEAIGRVPYFADKTIYKVYSVGGYDLSQTGNHDMVSLLVSYNQPVGNQLVRKEEKSILKEKCVSISPVRVIINSRALDRSI